MPDLSINSDQAAPYRHDIDGLRAIAILLVIFYHFDFSFVGAGFYGVDIFFVISGFLITGTSLKNISSLRDVKSFFQKRAARILPMMAVVTTACVVFWRIELGPFQWMEIRRTTPSVALFFANVFYWKNLDYFRALAETNPFVHTWSLSLEEQFYIVAPFAMLVTNRPRILLLVVATLSIATLFFAKPAGAFYLLPCRAWEFCAGAALIYLARPSNRKVANSASILGLLMILAGLVVVRDTSESSPFWRVLPVLGTAAIIWAGQLENIVSRALSWRPTALIGRISYSTYLIHWPIWVFATIEAETPLSVSRRLWLVAIVLIASYLIFQLIEGPAQRLVRTISPSKALIASFVLILLTASMPFLTSKVYSAGLFMDFDFDEFTATGERGVCFLNLGQTKSDYRVEPCIPKFDGRKRVLLWGDSFAAHYLYGLRGESEKEYATFQITMSACPPSRTSGNDTRCNEFNNFALDQALNSAKPDLVIVAANWAHADEIGHSNRTIDGIHSLIAKLKQNGIRALLVAQTPEFPIEVPIVLAKMRSDIPKSALLDAELHSELNQALQAEAAKSQIPFFDFGRTLCPINSRCLVRTTGKTLFFDKGHLSEFGSKLAAKSMLPIIAKSLETDPK